MIIASIISHKNWVVRQVVFMVLFFMSLIPGHAQTIIGTTGLMNVPTADMRPAGTFDGGVSFIQKGLLFEHYYLNRSSSKYKPIEQEDYNTFLFYVSFTPFPWVELSYRETLIKRQKSKTDTQAENSLLDRSWSVRIQPLKEGKYWPAVVVGVNDLFTSGSLSGGAGGSSPYAAVYGVASKHVPLQDIGTFEATVGYAHPVKKGQTYDGVMGGLSFAPAFFPDIRVMGEYDTRGYNVGVGASLFKHLNVTCFTREFKGFDATVSYQYTISY